MYSVSLILLSAITSDISNCKQKRTQTIIQTFDEIKRVASTQEVTQQMLEHYIPNMPWYGRLVYGTIIKPRGGAPWIMQRCANKQGVITQASAISRETTCFSKCLYVDIVHKCLSWGYADYY